MEHIAALLLIVGCSADLADCRELPAPVPIFETAEECDVELTRAFNGYAGSYPHVLASCVAVDPAMEEADAELVWEVRKDRTLVASIEAAGAMVASNSEGNNNTRISRE